MYAFLSSSVVSIIMISPTQNKKVNIMKDILIVVSQATEKEISEAYNKLSTVAPGSQAGVQQPIENTWLLSGPQSFERATKICGIADKHNFSVAVFEIESVLHVPLESVFQGSDFS